MPKTDPQTPAPNRETRMFAKTWLVAMTIAATVTAGIIVAEGDANWAAYAGAVAFVGALTWGIWGAVQVLTPWIER